MDPSKDGIILLAKQSGITSFSSLWQIKNALGTKKIGHTGTLDTFAEGLLVVCAGRLTRLVSYITDCDKAYEAVITFGTETDTLDPDGQVIKTSDLPKYGDILDSLPSFRGAIQQQPPAYSAIHVGGQRASDRIRKGEAVELPFRPIIVYSLDFLETVTSDGGKAESSSLISSIKVHIVCSKGTYIRSLARDIALASRSCAHLAGLRRTRIGPFSLEEAAGFSMLPPFGSVPPAVYGVGDRPPQVNPQEIQQVVRSFHPSLASQVGLTCVFLDPSFLRDFLNGKTILSSWFAENIPANVSEQKAAVFCGEEFVGVVLYKYGAASYEFVMGHG